MKMDTLIDQKLKSKKEKKQYKNLSITLVRINSNKEGFDIFDEISEIQDFVYESGFKVSEELKKNRLIEDLERSVKIIKLS